MDELKIKVSLSQSELEWLYDTVRVASASQHAMEHYKGPLTERFRKAMDIIENEQAKRRAS